MHQAWQTWILQAQMVLQDVRDNTGKDAHDSRVSGAAHRTPPSSRGEPRFLCASDAISPLATSERVGLCGQTFKSLSGS